MFSIDEERQIRYRLADALKWVVSQRLLPTKVEGGRIAIFEIMQNNIRIKDSIINGESEGKTFYEIIENGQAYHMQTFDQNIIEIFKKGLITEDTALAYCTSRSRVRRGIDAVKSLKGEKTSDIDVDGLTIDLDYKVK